MLPISIFLPAGTSVLCVVFLSLIVEKKLLSLVALHGRLLLSTTYACPLIARLFFCALSNSYFFPESYYNPTWNWRGKSCLHSSELFSNITFLYHQIVRSLPMAF